MRRLEIIKANADEHPIVTEITKKSKAYWGYSQEKLKAWSDLNDFIFKIKQNKKNKNTSVRRSERTEIL